MEQITINVMGNNAQEKAARLMKAIYKTMAKINDPGCHITISSRKETAQQEEREIQIPEFMQAVQTARTPMKRERMG